MSKAVIISIRPEWCAKIASGEKIVEVRKTRPKIDTPFKCYIYKTKTHSGELDEQAGRVIGEYICTGFFPLMVSCSAPDLIKPIEVYGTGMTDVEIMRYLGNGVVGYGWNITQLKIYNKPKDLGDFRIPCQRQYCYEQCPRLLSKECNPNKGGFRKAKRPPQSWCYVEELP